MREQRTYGSVRGATSDGRSYRDPWLFNQDCSPAVTRALVPAVSRLIATLFVPISKSLGQEGVKKFNRSYQRPLHNQIRPYASPKSLSGTSRAGG